MKKTLLLKTMLLLWVLIVGSSNVWADSYTITFATGSGDGTSASTSTACSTVVSDGATYLSGNLATATKVYYGGSDGLKVGTSSAAGAIKMNLASNVTPTSIVVNAKLYNSSKAATLKVNGSTAQSITSSFSNLTFNITSEISYLQLDVSKYCWIKSITVNYASASSAEATTTTIDATGITNTNKFVGTAAGSLRATVKDNSDNKIGGATVTWSSNNEAVATIGAETGDVTLVGAGTVTFTASYAGVTDTYQSSSDTYEMTVINEDPDIVTIWSENFSNYSANDVPSGGTYGYACKDGSSDTKIYAANLAGGVSPELLVGKTGGSFTATIPLLYPTYGYSGNLTLTFKANNTNVAISTSTEGVTVTGSVVAGTSTLTLSGITTSMENVVITFTNSESSNVRLDDIVLKGKQAALSVVATPSISPASGAVASGTEVTITCGTDGATIYYTTDGSTPTSGSTAYNPASKPTITSACTIKAIAIKGGLTDSEVAIANYTIAEPCATPTFSVAEGVVDKGTTVTISCGTADATIYYTTNGTAPTTSSSVYSSALTINTNQTIKAIAVKDGFANSEVASATYTIRDYATLPFEWDDTSTPTGVINNGVSTYSASPYLKFDGTGDELVLKINETPGVLTYDIKGNGFSDGTFKVQASADGSEYTDVATYTDLSSTTTVTIDSLASDIRYIKWIYTDKVSGNVALGNINLTAKAGSITLAAACTDGEKYYGTYSSSEAFIAPAGVTVAEISIVDGKLNVQEYSEGAVVPGNTGVMVSSTVAGLHNLSATENAGTSVLGVDNRLRATGNKSITADAMKTVDNDCVFYRLTMHNGTDLGFYWGAEEGAAFAVAANKAYLAVPKAAAARIQGFSFDGGTITGINNLTPALTQGEGAIFDLQGRSVANPAKGLYIKNGKKVVVK